MLGEQGAVKRYVDLHVHSTFSDGECTIREIIDFASQKGLKALSITDHDNLDAYPLAVEIAKEKDLEIIPGTELCCEIQGVDVHILGYFVDYYHTALRSKLEEMKRARFIRAKKIVENLNRQGIDLRFETVLKIAGEGAIGRPHIASAMLQEELIYSFKEAFDKYIGYDSPAYVEKLKLLPKEVFQLILDAGGIPVLAHPGITKIDPFIPQFIKEGLAGIEVYHAEHTLTTKRFYMEYGRAHNLVITGGSDFHSSTQSRTEIGNPRLSYSVVKKLKARVESIHGKKVAL